MAGVKMDVYSVWALPPAHLLPRFKHLMSNLRSNYGGPLFDPHVTLVGAVRLTETEARRLFTTACRDVKTYTAVVDKIATGTFFYQCVFLLLRPSPEVLEASSKCCSVFNYQNSTSYMPHLSLLYGNLSDEEKVSAQEKAYGIDDAIEGLSFEISRLALWKTDTEDTSCQSWEMIAEHELTSN